MKSLFLSTVCFLLFFPAATFAQKYSWAGVFAPPTSVIMEGQSVATDPQGNVYLTGSYKGTIDFDPGPGVYNLTATGVLNDIYVCKFDNSGTLVWAKSMGGTNADISYAIAVDNLGNVYTTGFFLFSSDFDPGPGVVSLYGDFWGDTFISKLDADGNYVWARSIGGVNTQDLAHGIGVDDNGNVYVLGDFLHDLDVDPGPGVVMMSAGSQRNVFLLKLDQNGIYANSLMLNYSSFDESTDLVVRNGRICALVYAIEGSYINQYDSDLNLQWRNLTDCWARAIATDNAGNIITAGSFGGAVDFDPGPNDVIKTSVDNFDDMFIRKLDRYGNFVWVRTMGTTSTDNEMVNDITTDSNGEIYATGNFILGIDFDSANVNSHLDPQGRDMFVEKVSGTGKFQWVVKMGGTGSEFGRSIAVDDASNVFTTGYFQGSADFNPDPAVSNNLSVLVAGSGSAAFLSKLSAIDHICGTAFMDINNDGLQQAAERGYPYLLVSAQSGSDVYYGISDTSGKYDIYVDPGSYTIHIPVLPAYYTWAQAAPTAIFSGPPGATDSLNYIPLYPQPGVNDLSINSYAVSIPRPGRDLYLDLVYRNTGTTTLSGNVNLQHDAELTYQQSTIVPNNYTSPLLTWNFSNLLPMETRKIRIQFTVSASVVSGTPLQQMASINPMVNDTTPANNTEVRIDLVRASFDPNEKSVLPEGPVTPAFINADSTYLDYCIRFQNTGNDTAFVVVITDTMQNTLDLASLKIMAASHSFSVKIVNGNVLRFSFDNIMLPDSTTNEALSHGYIAFRVKPFTTLTAGTAINNQAAIFFDFNTAVNTNEVTNLIVDIVPIGLSAFDASSYECSKAFVRWSTGSDINNVTFMLEKSADAVNWNTIAQINSNMTHQYDYQDMSGFKGAAYYRLKQVNADGSFQYSVTRRVACEAASRIKIYPNPSKDVLNIENTRPFSYRLYDSNGSLIMTGNSPGNYIRLHPGGLQAGIYMLKIMDEAGVSIQKVMVK